MPAVPTCSFWVWASWDEAFQGGQALDEQPAARHHLPSSGTSQLAGPMSAEARWAWQLFQRVSSTDPTGLCSGSGPGCRWLRLR